MLPFVRPALLLLALPVGWAWQRFGRTGDWRTDGLRGALAALLIAAAAGPVADLSGEGTDVVLLLDRSRSMPADDAALAELVRNVDAARGPGDRLGVVTFGGRPAAERPLSAAAATGEFLYPIDADGTDLNAALHLALDLTDPRRPARLLTLSDGEANGPDPRDAARRARAAGTPIDVRPFPAVRSGDAAITALTLPASAAPGEPIAVGVEFVSLVAARGRVSLARREPGGPATALASREVDLPAGRGRVRFRDLAPADGFHLYTATLEVPGDPRSENDRGEAGLRIDAPRRVLLLREPAAGGGADGATGGGRIGRALAAAGIEVDVAAPGERPLTQDSLDPYGAVILDDVPASSLGRRKMTALVRFVEDLGGGLLTTGGRNGYALGGYFESPLDPALPVSMDLREDAQKERSAIVVALDRSGSMAVPVGDAGGGGRTKMDLANEGAAAAVAVLSRGDRAAVLAVDTAAEAIVPLTEIDAGAGRVAAAARGIVSSGGGIYVDAALDAAADQLDQAPDAATKHVIVFADAADAESPTNYVRPLERLRQMGATVSVIGLGSRLDSDAPLLEAVAAAGGGNVLFTDDPRELPRLFAQDALAVVTDTFVTAETPAGIPGEFAPGVALVGELGAGAFPGVGGYNLTELRDDASLTVRTRDQYAAPLAAAWYRGLGRVASLTFPLHAADDGGAPGPVGDWVGLNDFLLTHVRWLMSGGDGGGAYLTAEREGRTAAVTVELDPERADDDAGDELELLVVPPADDPDAGPPATPFPVDLRWDGPATLSGRFELELVGTYRTLLRRPGGLVTRGPPVSLPYSPEFLPRDDRPPGAATLEEIAALSGGVRRADVATVFNDPPPRPAPTALWPWFAAAGVGLLLWEIAGRRWQWALPWKAANEVVATPRTRERRAVAAPVRPEGSTGPPAPAVRQGPKANADDVFGAAKANAGRRL
ncbi:vWA domain-containing protein [Alienimonas californiensis]|uniref:von Willebrand factor type A domain protein n=1 Tax=Alienimonas californiensis TaxID=2527989 RepID=A0A517PEE3_9PLAN|nr:vWA domain-containing protein [Alienimonas californiensis]QDT17728.1 von Willebrand factor type A domain protein [Alienimonas californiensis]